MILLILILWLFLLAKPAQAYLDPGTGSYITQVMIGLLVGGGYALKVYGKKIIHFIQNIFKGHPRDENKKDNS
jgi:hypothetical protein